MQSGDDEKRIRGVVRIRPLKKGEGLSVVGIEKDSKHGLMCISVENVSLDSMGRCTKEKILHKFDACYGPDTTQLDFFQREVAPHLDVCLSGHTATFFCYGMTGTGKSFTMQGGTDSNAGLIPRVVESMLAKAAVLEQAELSLSYLELYNERVFDLLVPNSVNMK
jgi:hypothetical protein